MQTTLFKCAELAGFSLSKAQLSCFSTYADLLLEWNKKMNLTAITEPVEIATKHFADSLFGLPFLKEKATVIDVGTGAGFPGIPLKIARPDISLTLLDSLNKRLTFLDTVLDTLSLTDTKTIHARAEDGAKSGSALREHFDICVSRAVSRLNVLAEYCLPYVKVGGMFLAYKGNASDELAEAENAIHALGGSVADIFTYNIPETDISHCIIAIEKIAPTPSQYPRLQGKITKKPL